MPTNPGSAEAKRLGCTCPVLDNAYGKGAVMEGKIDHEQFYTDPDCPIHRDRRLVNDDDLAGGEADSGGDAGDAHLNREHSESSPTEAILAVAEREGDDVDQLQKPDVGGTALPRSGTETS